MRNAAFTFARSSGVSAPIRLPEIRSREIVRTCWACTLEGFDNPPAPLASATSNG